MTIEHAIQMILCLGILVIVYVLLLGEGVNLWNLLTSPLKPSVSQSVKQEETQKTTRIVSSPAALIERAIMPTSDLVKCYFYAREKLLCNPAEAWALACAITHPTRHNVI